MIPFPLLLLACCATAGQTGDSWTRNAFNEYRVVPDITYSVADDYECKLDVYTHRAATPLLPTILYFHGGGWVKGAKEEHNLAILPYLEMGYNLVNVEYRLARVSLAPAAVEDGRQALRWVYKNAGTYSFDTSRIIVVGASAGGHLALMTGLLAPQDGFDNPTEWEESTPPLKVAAVINWYGIIDVADLLEGPNRRQFAASWFGSMDNRQSLAKRLSPLSYVRKGMPPVLSIHGESDTLVPFEQAQRFHQALAREGAANLLVSVKNGYHGGFSREKMDELFGEIRKFLEKHGLSTKKG